jgi:hypothetical protein
VFTIINLFKWIRHWSIETLFQHWVKMVAFITKTLFFRCFFFTSSNLKRIEGERKGDKLWSNSVCVPIHKSDCKRVDSVEKSKKSKKVKKYWKNVEEFFFVSSLKKTDGKSRNWRWMDKEKKKMFSTQRKKICVKRCFKFEWAKPRINKTLSEWFLTFLVR